MASEEMNLVPSQRMENGLSSQIVFQDEGLQFNCSAPQRRVADPARKTREVSGFVEEKMFPVDRDRYFRTSGPEFRRGLYDSSPGRQDRPETQQNWNADASAGTPSIDGSEGEEEDEDDDEDDEDDEVDGEVEGLVAADDSNKNNNNSSSSVHSSSEKIRSEKSNLQKHHSSFGGSGRGVLVKDGNVVQSATSIRGSPSEQQHQQGRMTHCENAVTIAEPDMYYSQFFQGAESSVLAQKEIGENGCGFSGRKDGSLSTESGESLRTILSDPLTGTLMDDAMILPCGHSFGSGGMQHVIRMDQHTGELKGKGRRLGRLFVLEFENKKAPSNSCLLSTTSSFSPTSYNNVWHLWHKRLGHTHAKNVDYLFSSGCLSMTVTSFKNVDQSCLTCCYSKSHVLPFPSSTEHASTPFYLIYSDVWLSLVISRLGYKYFVLFIIGCT